MQEEWIATNFLQNLAWKPDSIGSFIQSPMEDPTTATTLVLEIPCNVSGECNSTWRPPWMGCSYALFAFLSAHGRKIHEHPGCKVDQSQRKIARDLEDLLESQFLKTGLNKSSTWKIQTNGILQAHGYIYGPRCASLSTEASNWQLQKLSCKPLYLTQSMATEVSKATRLHLPEKIATFIDPVALEHVTNLQGVLLNPKRILWRYCTILMILHSN